MNVGALPRRCRPFSLAERSVCFILEAPFLGECRKGHGLFICQWRNGNLCSSKTEGRVIGYLSMTQGGHGYFFVGVTLLPADDARKAYFLFGA